MIIHKGYKGLNLRSPVVTLGIFDGVHLGHKALLESLVSRARELDGESVVITFSPHPRLVLEKDHVNLSFLTTLEEKILLLERENIDHLIIIEFNARFSKIEACDFIKKVIVKQIGSKHLLIGYDHHFGRSGEGDYNTIRRCTESLGFNVEQLQGLYVGEVPVSSSIIRDALLKGNIDDANKWLGYPYSVGGRVVAGRKIGRIIGFPTANIKPDCRFKLIPSNGVYAVEVQIDDKKYPGMLSIGTNPTVSNDAGARSIEVNILDFDKDIYGCEITVIFRKRLRDEIKFDNTQQLAGQMKIDRQSALRSLGLIE